MPHRVVKDGDEVFVRARVLEGGVCSDAFKVEIVDYPQMAVTVWVPARECAKVDDIHKLMPKNER